MGDAESNAVTLIAEELSHSTMSSSTRLQFITPGLFNFIVVLWVITEMK